MLKCVALTILKSVERRPCWKSRIPISLL